jgi:hypothetical protein
MHQYNIMVDVALRPGVADTTDVIYESIKNGEDELIQACREMLRLVEPRDLRAD